LEAGGTAFDPNLARITARATQVEHVVNSTFDSEETLLDGDPQVIDLPFKCEEGPLSGENAAWLNWCKKGGSVQYGGHQHQQFFNIFQIKVVS
jgi:hypothetical protein